jgi:hypothetical protein
VHWIPRGATPKGSAGGGRDFQDWLRIAFCNGFDPQKAPAQSASG